MSDESKEQLNEETPFDEWLSQEEIFGSEQWSESCSVVNRAHEGLDDNNRLFREISVFIPTGIHFMFAYIEYKRGRIDQKHWEEYKNHFPKRYKGARVVDLAVKRYFNDLIYNDCQYELHMLVHGQHNCLTPLQSELPLDNPNSSVSSDSDDGRGASDVILLLKKLLHKSVGWRAELQDFTSFVQSFRWQEFSEEEKQLLVDFIHELPTEPRQSPYEEFDVPF